MWTAAGDAPAPLFDLGGAPAGNMTASLADIARWGQVLLRGSEGVVDGEALASMWTPASRDSSKGYGLGFALDTLDGWRSVGHGGAVYGYSSVLSLLPDAGLGIAVISTLDFTGELVGRLARRALRLALADRGLGPLPEAARRLPMAGANLARALAGRYVAPDGDAVELRPWADRLMLIEAGVPLELRPLGSNRFALDGRLHGEDTAHSFPIIEIEDHAGLYWRDRLWQRSPTRPAAAPPDLAVYLGDYDPAFMPTRLSFANGRLCCLIENLSPHECVPLGGKRFLMRGPMYEDETLELGVQDADGHPAIRIGEMILSKRRA
jgi:Beta-lactamase